MRPRLAARLARRRNRVEAPDALSGPRVVGIDVAPAREVSTRHSNNHLVLEDERRRRDRVGILRIADRDVPDDITRLPVECDEMRVECAHVQAIAENPKAAIHGPATDRRRNVGRQPASIAPNRTARPPIDGPRLVVVPGQVQNAVNDKRRIFQATPGKARNIGLEYPLRNESRDILRRQLLQRTVPLPRVIAGKRQPAGGILQTLDQVPLGDRNRRRLLLRSGGQHPQREGEHHHGNNAYYHEPAYTTFRICPGRGFCNDARLLVESSPSIEASTQWVRRTDHEQHHFKGERENAHPEYRPIDAAALYPAQ